MEVSNYSSCDPCTSVSPSCPTAWEHPPERLFRGMEPRCSTSTTSGSTTTPGSLHGLARSARPGSSTGPQHCPWPKASTTGANSVGNSRRPRVELSTPRAECILAAAHITDAAVVNDALYWAASSSTQEARFLTAILNSTGLAHGHRPAPGARRLGATPLRQVRVPCTDSPLRARQSAAPRPGTARRGCRDRCRCGGATQWQKLPDLPTNHPRCTR